jgi:hypothetical protein
MGRDGGERHLSEPYTGQPFDPEKWELREGSEDHGHCDGCWATSADGVA